ncbi:TusE/DsrC/DsvC family sulfur relay protein [Thiobacillus denitrificans]|uniref:TusE/DsrC/DsvC family sulfur relay protein n=1 Tax=Thiobacillus denitrificans TaxID=36861 RepID=UPI0003806B01|nr:TusE/DsrC/DsvC family sulfur relay protein [Thiobacillus denitrificans]
MNAALTLLQPFADDISEWFDADGYFAKPPLWSSQLAERIALEEGIPVLTPQHWQVINHVRNRYFALGSLPVMRLVCRSTGLDRHKAHKLFLGCKSLWRVAGLPNPGAEASAYMN